MEKIALRRGKLRLAGGFAAILPTAIRYRLVDHGLVNF